MPLASPETDCPFCGEPRRGGPASIACAVCGMRIEPPHFPHIVRIEPRGAGVHFCSISCMDNYDYATEGEDG